MRTKITLLTFIALLLFSNGYSQCWQSVAAGYESSAAIKTDGTLWTWGWNAFGQLGLGNTTNVTTPAKVGTATWKVVSVGSESTNSAYTMAIQTNGTLWGWGGNGNGELGIGNTVQQNSPVQVGTATNWKYVYAGLNHTIAIKTDGTMWAWGRNTYGQLGDGTTTNRLSPVQVGTDTNWKMATSGGSNTFALKTDGTLWACGDNAGYYGNGTTVNSNVPIQISAATDWQSISRTMGSILAIKTDGTLWAWGDNNFGELGIGSAAPVSYTPVQVGSSTWKSAYAAWGSSFGIKTDGTLWAWGDNAKGQLGDNTVVNKSSPVQIGTANDWASVGTGLSYTFGIKTDGSMSGWGANQIYQLGLGNTTEYHVPTAINCYSGCTTAVEGLYPTTTFTPACSGSQETITVDAWAGEYSNVNVLANRSYTFRSSVSTDFITITNAAATVIYVSGTTPVSWVSNNAEVIRYFLNTNASCGSQQTSRVRYVTCADLSCNTPGGLTAGSITGTSATISWTAASPAPASGYEYYYSDINTAPTTTASGSVSAGVLSKSLTGLTAGVRYYYWVRSKCSATISGNWVAGGSFVAQDNAPCLNGTQYPSTNFTPACTGSQETIVTNAWAGEYTVVNVVPNKKYTFRSSVGTDYISVVSSDGLTVYATGVTPVTWSSNAVSGTIKYYFHLSSGCGTQQTSRTRYITCEDACGQPSNVTVSNVSATSASVSWTAPAVAPGADYQYYLSTVATAPTPATAATAGTGSITTSLSLSDLTPSTTYYFWLRSRCSGNNTSDWTSGGAFTTPACELPSNITISNITAGSATLSWTPPSSLPAFGYQYYYSMSNTAPSASDAPSGSVSPSVSSVSINLLPSSTYFVWMRSRCGLSAYSNWVLVGSAVTFSCESVTNVSIRSVYEGFLVVEFDRPAEAPTGYDYYVSTSATEPTATTQETGAFYVSTVDEGYVFNLMSSTTYYVWMRSNCGSISRGPWISAGSATTLACVPPTSVSIGNVYSTTAEFNTTGYNSLQYYYNTTGVAPTASTASMGYAFSNPGTLQGLSPSTTYYLWVRSYCDTFAYSDWVAASPFTTDQGREIIGSFVNNTTGSTTSFNQSDSVTFTFSLVTPGYWTGAGNLYLWAQSYNEAQANMQPSPNNGTFNAPLPASALTANPNGTYSVTLNPVSSYFANQVNLGRLEFTIKNASGSKYSLPAYAVVVDPIPAPAASDQVFCSQVSVASLVATGSNIKWYTASSGGTALASDSLLTTGAYYASQTINGSESLARKKINVTVNTVSVTPASSEICGSEIQALTVNASINNPVRQLGSGVSTNTNYTPYQGYWGGARSQAVYTASELSALGLHSGSPINSIGYKVTSGTPIQLSNFTIKAGFTTVNVLEDFIQSPDYTVFTQASYVPQTGNGEIDYTLSTPLVWDGISNLLVETCYNNNNNGGTPVNNLNVESSEVATKLYKHVKVDNEPNICSRATIYEPAVRPNLRILSAPETMMTWSPVEGLYTDATATVPYVAGENRAVVYAKPSTFTVYTSTVVSPSCTIVNTASVDAHFTPAPESSKQYFCSGATVANLNAVGSNIKWYDAENNLLTSGTMLQTGLYFVTQTAHGCESTKAAVSVIINDTPAPAATAQSFCFEATVADLAATGTDLQWFDSENHVLALTDSIHTGTYYVSQTGHGCESPKTVVPVTIFNTAAPISADQEFCGTATVSELTAVGDNIRWYDGSNHIVSDSDVLQSGVYFVTQTQNGCESDRTMVIVTVNQTPAPAAESQTFCGVALVSDLNALGSGLRWYDAEDILLAPTDMLSTGTYYVSQSVAGCESEKTAVTVTVNSTPSASAADQAFCAGAIVADLIASGTDLRWYDNDHLLSSPDALLETGIYYVSQTAHGCESDMTPINVTINPSTTSEETATACDSYEWNGREYTESGDYTYEGVNAFGCTHTSTLHLTVNRSTTTDETATACGSYLWHGVTYTNSGDYTYSGTNATGCTETGTLHLTVSHTAAPTATAQSFCSGSISSLTAAGTDIKWYASPTGGTALGADTALEMGTYYASQTLGGCESDRTAVSVTVQVGMPSAASPQTFVCGARRTNLSATGTTLRWYTTPSGGTAMASSDLLASGTYYVTQTIDGCQSSRRAVEVIVNTIAAPVSNDQTHCYNATVANLTASGTDIRWYATAAGGTALSTGTQLTAGTYYASQKTGSCESARTAVLVTLSGPALPDAPQAQAYNCGSRRTSLVATGTGLKWYTSPMGGTPMLSSAQLVTGPYYVSQTIDGCEGPRREVSVTILYPSAPTASTQFFCTAATVANLYATGSGIKWYASETDTTPLASTTPLVTATYYASQTNSMMCESARTAVEVITGGAPMPEAPSPQTFVCGTRRPSLAATGSGLAWYTVPSGGTALSSTAVLSTGTYYVSQTVSGCVSGRRAVSVIITNPSAPAATAQVLCSGSTVANLAAAGTSLKWYTSQAGGTALATGTILSGGTYYVSQSVGGCESDRTAVSVTINTVAMPDAPSPQVFSCNVKRPALTATGTNLLWYTVATGGSALPSTAQLATGTYYVSQTIDGCTSARRAVSVSVNATAPPAVSDQSLCQGKLVSDLVATGTALRWYASASGGTSLAGSSQLTAGTYYVSQTLNGCESLRAAANVTLISCMVRMPEMVQQETLSQEAVAAGYGIRIFPNPTSSLLNIRSDGDFRAEHVVILDSAGRVVLEQKGTEVIDVSRFAAGVYILRATSGERQYQAKFVKE
ncbi:fibronectin type III domain-containing protein [Flavobacterium magnum]|nr:fibronectin type III domain-containing protein [Flavobacterium magnum]